MSKDPCSVHTEWKWGISFGYCNEHIMQLLRSQGRNPQKNGRWVFLSSEPYATLCQRHLCTSSDSLCPYSADCFVSAWTRQTAASVVLLLGLTSCLSGMLVPAGCCCAFISFWLLPPLRDLDKTPHYRAHYLAFQKAAKGSG